MRLSLTNDFESQQKLSKTDMKFFRSIWEFFYIIFDDKTYQRYSLIKNEHKTKFAWVKLSK